MMMTKEFTIKACANNFLDFLNETPITNNYGMIL